MSKKYENAKEYASPWYALTTNRLVATLGPLREEVNCDICIVGGGFTGLSAALELTLKGYSVVLLESQTIASSASGRNGGHLQRGFGMAVGPLVDKFGVAQSKTMLDISLEGIELVLLRIKEYGIQCDLKFGHLTAAMDQGQIRDLQKEVKDWEKVGHDDFQLLDNEKTQSFINCKKYIGGMLDMKAGHFHPLNFALGVAQAAQKRGCRLYENTPATALLSTGPQPKIKTAQGAVTAKFVILAGAVDMPGLGVMQKKSVAATAHMIATEPLSEKIAQDIFRRDIAVIDASFIMNYYRLSADRRMLFGGNCNYSGKDFPGEDMRLRKRMTDLFPSLSMTRIDHCWHGPLDLTINRMPHLGRLSPQVYFAHGFGGHGVVATNILGKIMAEAVSGTAERFDVFSGIGHLPFPGGNLLKQPLFALGMLWYRLRDLL